jgi:hypothetical protein
MCASRIWKSWRSARSVRLRRSGPLSPGKKGGSWLNQRTGERVGQGQGTVRLELARALRWRDDGRNEAVRQLEEAIRIIETARSNLRLPPPWIAREELRNGYRRRPTKRRWVRGVCYNPAHDEHNDSPRSGDYPKQRP